MDREVLNKYFDEMFKEINPEIVLDNEQREAITSEEDKVLIIAGAGTGKTTTMAAKVKYLVDIKKVEPSKILVMSYTKKATKELEEIIVNKFKIPAHVTTFHSLGYEYIRKIFKNHICTIVDTNEKNTIFYNYFKEIFKDKNKIKKIIENFNNLPNSNKLFSKYFLENYEKYNTYEEFFESYKNYKIEEAKTIGIEDVISFWENKMLNAENIHTIQGKLVKSAAECTIANFLFKKGIDYEYEKVYTEIMEEQKTYKPDFTINYGGKEIYLEYFGLNDPKYNKIKEEKIKFHQKYNPSNFIYLENTPIEKIEIELDQKLKKLNIAYHPKTSVEIYTQILNNNELSNVYRFKNFLYGIVNEIKESKYRNNYYEKISKYIETKPIEEQEKLLFQRDIISEFYKYYFKNCYTNEKYGFDYTDLLYYANKYINELHEQDESKYKYIIIDEYQDISESKYLLTKKTMDKYNSRLFAVGDDWQSIYSFSGSKIEYIYNITKYLPGIKIYNITKTYRNPQELINCAGTFILKNPSQNPKKLISDKTITHPIIIKGYSIVDENGYINYDAEYLSLKNTIKEIHKQNPNHNILILSRRNADINYIFNDTDFIDSLDTKIIFKEYKNLEIDAMSIHKSKGLTFDEVIIIGLNNKFPMDNQNKYWISGLFTENNLSNEKIEYAEERRLFYVALTRTKNRVYLLKNTSPKYRSRFIDEIEEIMEKYNY